MALFTKGGAKTEQIVFTAGDNIVQSLPRVTYFNTTSYQPYKEVRINTAGTYRVKFIMWNGSSTYTYARIYKNGVAYGTERSLLGPSSATFTEDLTFAANDLVSLRARGYHDYSEGYISNYTFGISSNVGVPYNYSEVYA